MTIAMWQRNGEWAPVRGNPMLLSVDGALRAPFSTVMAPSWSWPDRWMFGIHELEPAEIPDGFHSVKVTYRKDPDGLIREEHVLEEDHKPEFIPVDTGRIRRRDGSAVAKPTPPDEPIR